MAKLYRIESYHDDGRGSVNPKIDTFVRAAGIGTARLYVARMFDVNVGDVLLSVYSGQPPVDSMVLNAEQAAAA